MKTSELSGAALDWAVAKCEFPTALTQDLEVWVQPLPCDDPNDFRFQPSTNWAQGGPIIEREMICVNVGHAGIWLACIRQNYGDLGCYMKADGSPLIATMRCYVASKLGDEIEIPKELS